MTIQEEKRLRAALREGHEMIADAVDFYRQSGRYPAAEIEWLDETFALVQADDRRR